MKYKSVLFDLDGTLVDSEPGIWHSVRHAAKMLGQAEPDESMLHSFFGPPLLFSFETIMGLPLEQAYKAVDLYRENYAADGIWRSKLFAGIEPMLAALNAAGVKMYIATSKPERFARILLDTFRLEKYFDGVCTQQEDTRQVGKASIVAQALSMAGEALPALMVGDTQHDVNGAQENHLDAAAVLWGGTDDFKGDNLVCIAATAQELQNFILGDDDAGFVHNI